MNDSICMKMNITGKNPSMWDDQVDSERQTSHIYLHKYILSFNICM